MASNFDNLRNKKAKVFLSSIADSYLELILNKNFVEQVERFDDCVQWYRKLIYYLNALAGMNIETDVVNEEGLLQGNCGELGSLTYKLYIDSDEKLNALVVDFSFNQFKSLIFEKKKCLVDIITEAIMNRIKNNDNLTEK